LSVIAGLTMWNFYFEVFTETIRGEHVIVFLQHLLRYLAGDLLIVWDGLPAHRSRLMNEYLRSLHGRILVERLPAYAPELNPVEYLWAYLKHHALPNVCPKDLWQLGEGARRCLRRMRRRLPLITSCWKQSSLWE
jgi:transposase